METVDVNTGTKSYPVYISEGNITQLQNIIDEHVPQCSSVLIVTDSNVAPLYLKKVKACITNQSVFEWVIPAGETSKSLREFDKGITYALRCQLDRNALVLALGGGVVGDLAGFIASTYLRGIRFIQIPTTLLAHDSSVGGKVGINHPLGKNLIGSFHQPEAVLYDVQFLNTLSKREWRSGFAEVLKLALIQDPSFYNELFAKVKELPIEREGLIPIIKHAIEIKADIVGKDEKESGVRAFLNFGHTLGHAIETESRYQTISHGEAVMIGMVFAMRLSERMFDKDIMPAEFVSWIQRLGYTVWHPTLNKSELLLETMKKDKKVKENKIRMVLLEKCGDVKLESVEDRLLIEELMNYRSWVKENMTK
ncbi:3-dehydroquinate synthase [Pseudalkalibacillus sp. SCS-8]|uniref:3-dehydroquinate synthase n=1 Tax=Pseudalkalibacillus nanhaiensis TaxID=3115291 RepID=UPI0032DA18E8